MFIECVKNNGTDYLRVVEGFNYNENGKRKQKRRVLKNIGPLARFDDGEPEYSVSDWHLYENTKRKRIMQFRFPK